MIGLGGALDKELEEIGFDFRPATAKGNEPQAQRAKAGRSAANHDCLPSAMACQMRSRTRWSSRAVFRPSGVTA